MTRLEPASFEVERFELGRDDCLEAHDRWFGIRVRVPRRPVQSGSPIRPRGGTEDHPPAPSPTAASRSVENAERLGESVSGARTVRRDVTDMWRARLVAIAALLIALVVIIVLLALR